MQYLSPVTATEKYSSLPNKLGIFEISSDQLFQHSFRYGPIAVIYFLAKSCIHAVWPPENDQNVLYLSFCSNWQIPWLGSKFRVPQKTVVPSQHHNASRQHLLYRHDISLWCLCYSVYNRFNISHYPTVPQGKC